MDKSFWLNVTLVLQIAGIVCGVACFTISIVTVVIASRTKPYAGQAKVSTVLPASVRGLIV